MATFNNFATLSYHGLTAVSNLVTGEITDSLRMTKTAVAETYVPGGSVTYAVSIVNAGATEYSGLTLSDDLGAYTFNTETLVPLVYQAGSLQYFVNGELQPLPAVTPGPPLVVTGITVPAGGSAMLLYAVTFNDYAPPCGGQVENTASLTGSALTDALTTTAVLAPACEPVLGIAKSIDPAAVRRSGELTYTFLITNTGGQAAEAEDNVSVTDSFSPVLKGLTVTLNGSALSTTQYTYNAATGAFATNPGIITVPAAVFSQDPESGLWTRSPGESTLTVSGTI